MRVFATVGMCLAIFAHAAVAQLTWTNSGSGNWVDGSNWSGGSAPGLFDPTEINNGGMALISDGDVAESDFATLGATAGSSGSIQMTGGEFMPFSLEIGEVGTGMAEISGGTVSVGGESLFIGGRFNEGVGTLTVNGPAVMTSDDDVQLGRVGEGTLNLSDGRMEGVFTVVGKFGKGTWNQSGGLFVARQDLEIGDGGRPDESSTQGPREGTINLDGGVLQADDFAIGNRVGTGIVNISGNGRLAVTEDDGGDIWVGRGSDWAGNAGAGGPTELRVTGPDAIVVANNDFLMNLDSVASSSTLTAVITGPTHTTVKVKGDAILTNGTLKVELDDYSPVAGDSWTILQAGVDFADELATIDAELDAAGLGTVDHGAPLIDGSLDGTMFGSLDLTTDLGPGLSWDVSYTANDVILSVIGDGPLGDFNGDGSWDCADIDQLVAEIAAGSNSASLDLTGDGLVDVADRDEWLSIAGGINLASEGSYQLGDANLDGVVDVSDFNSWNTSKFTATAAWCSGDFDANGSVDVSDFNLWNQNKFTSADVASVPEPSTLWLAVMSLLPIGLRFRK